MAIHTEFEKLLNAKKLQEDELTHLINTAIVRLKQQDYEIGRLNSKVAQLKDAIVALTRGDNFEGNATPQLLTESGEMPTENRREFDLVFSEARRKFDNWNAAK